MLFSTLTSNQVTISCAQPTIQKLTILHINDLEGWLNPHDSFGGMATLMSYFKQEGYDPNIANNSFILTTGGDQNTGPAAATLSKGLAIVDTMNAMGFNAAAIGNHEFEYGIQSMVERQNRSTYPILSSNIYLKGTTDLANFTIPYAIQNHSGIRVGFIGLTTTATPQLAHPRNTRYFDFGGYEAALRRFIPQIKEKGVDIIVVLAHLNGGELRSLANKVVDLNISVFLGGGGFPEITSIGNATIGLAGHKCGQYAKIQLYIDFETKNLLSTEGSLIDNIEGDLEPDENIQVVVDLWEEKINATKMITYSSQNIYDNRGLGIGVLVTDSFLFASNYSYNFGVANCGGGFRDYFRAGQITLSDVVSVIPFEDYLMAFNITGLELMKFIEDNRGGFAFSGIKYSHCGGNILSCQIQINKSTFEELNTSKTYQGLILDYLWYHYYQDRFEAINLGIHYRNATLLYFKSLDDLAIYAYDNRYEESCPTSSFFQETVTRTNITFEFYPTPWLSIQIGISLLLLFSFLRKNKRKIL